jgi:hypothetical protein
MTSKENLVFHVENTGKKNHMIVAIKIPADGDLDAIIASQDLPEGVEELGGVFLFAPGDKADVVVKDKLAPGRYAFLCFATDADDPNHEPHVFKGMKSDFTVE